MSKLYSHAFSISFEVLSEREGEHVTDEELRSALTVRLESLSEPNDIREACGLPWDTMEE